MASSTAGAASKRFTNKGATDGRQYTPNVIGAAVRLFYSGVSYKQIAENIEEQYDVPEPSKGTIFYWVQDYTGQAQDAMKGRKAHTRREWVADEMSVKVGGQNLWLWNLMDSRPGSYWRLTCPSGARRERPSTLREGARQRRHPAQDHQD